MAENKILSNKEFQSIVSYAKASYANTTFPMNVSKDQLSHNEAINLLLLESFVVYLNRNGLLNQLVKFDHTNDIDSSPIE